MLICLIEPDAGYRNTLKYHLEVEWPDIQWLEFEHSTESVPTRETLADCDFLLLACPLPGSSGFAGLERFFDRSSYPPAILFAADGDELLAVDALKAGAASYFPKDRVTHRRLIDTLCAEMGAARPVASPTRLGRNGQYQVIETVHSTGLAAVYRARDPANPEISIAVKLLQYVPDSGGENLFDRFLQEFEIIAGIDHPNVVRIFELGVADDHAFIAMEYLGGGRLSDKLATALPPALALEYLGQVAGALGAVHAAGIFHRDLKPANIMFRADGSIALIDFGLAKWVELEAALTGGGKIFGTPFYMSPEQGHAEPADQRADLYSLGCIFYEMLTGLRPFTDSTAMGVIYRHANAPRPRLKPQIAAYQPLLDRLLAVRPDDRFQSAEELQFAIEALTDPAARALRNR